MTSFLTNCLQRPSGLRRLLPLDSETASLFHLFWMATEKGIFKDDIDRRSDAHGNMCAWFLDNADAFVRLFLFDRPSTRVVVTLERLVTHNKFIIGFADVILEYETDSGSNECVLIEVKSRLSDFGECLRQLRTYEAYLPRVTKLCVLNGDDRYHPLEDDDTLLRKYFSSQGVYVIDADTPFYNPNYCSLPSGRRQVAIDYAEPLGYDFNIYLSGRGFGEKGEDAESQVYLFNDLEFIRPFAQFVGMDVEPWYFDWSLKPFREIIGMKLLLDVEHFPATDGFSTMGWTEERYVALHLPDLSKSIVVR